MTNMLERFFVEALHQIPKQPTLSDSDLPQPEYPEHEGFDPAEAATEDDAVYSLEDILIVDNARRQLSWPDIPPRLPVRDDEDRALLDGGLRASGPDVYAFYKSRRHIDARPYPGKWGIFYLEEGIERISEIIESIYTGYGSTGTRAYKFLREHERFHFKFDLYALSIEAASKRSLYEPLKRAYRHHRIYQVEEALANRDAWEWAKREGLSEFAFDFMKLQPGAYARFDERKSDLAAELAANLLDLNLSRSARREDQAPWIGHVPKDFLRNTLCPEYFVQPSSLTRWISPAWKLLVTSIVESDRFTKLLQENTNPYRHAGRQRSGNLLRSRGCRVLA